MDVTCQLQQRRSAIGRGPPRHVHRMVGRSDIKIATQQTLTIAEFVRAVREIGVSSPPIQSTCNGLCEPLNLDNVRVSSLRIVLDGNHLYSLSPGPFGDALELGKPLGPVSLRVRCGGFVPGR